MDGMIGRRHALGALGGGAADPAAAPEDGDARARGWRERGRRRIGVEAGHARIRLDARGAVNRAIAGPRARP
jgi:hypothetical protein